MASNEQDFTEQMQASDGILARAESSVNHFVFKVYCAQLPIPAACEKHLARRVVKRRVNGVGEVVYHVTDASLRLPPSNCAVVGARVQTVFPRNCL